MLGTGEIGENCRSHSNNSNRQHPINLSQGNVIYQEQSSVPIPPELSFSSGDPNTTRNFPPLPPPPETKDARALRWGRSNFTENEIQSLDNPLDGDRVRDTPIFFAGSGNTVNPKNRPDSDNSKTVTKCQRLVEIFLIIFPAICFAAAAHFISDIRTDFKLFSASFSVFQGVFWPSFVFLVIHLIWGNKGVARSVYESVEEEESIPSRCLGLCCTNGRWKLSLLLLLQSTLSSIAVIAQLLSIQRLNISVSLALSFSSVIFVILLNYINHEKRCSVELIICSVLGYLGFIVVAIPAMISSSRHSEDLTAGLVASLVCMGTAILASFLLCQLRKSKIPDALTATSFALIGSLFSLMIKVLMDTTMDLAFDPMSIGWAAGLISLTIFGTIFTFFESKFRDIVRNQRLQTDQNDSAETEPPAEEDTPANNPNPNANMSRLRLLIFIFSCLWEIVRQGIWNTFPDVYDIFGSILVFVAFLLAVGFEAWTLNEPEEVKDSSPLFQFIPWLFSRGRRSNSNTHK